MFQYPIMECSLRFSNISFLTSHARDFIDNIFRGACVVMCIGADNTCFVVGYNTFPVVMGS